MDLIKVLEQERTRLNQLLDDYNKQKDEIDEKIAGVNAELKAIQAYETAKTGKKATKTAKRAVGITDQIINLVKATPMNRAQVIEALNGKGNKTIEQSVSNALSNLKKKGKLAAKDGVYSPA